MNKKYAIILAGGSGSRLGEKQPKQFLILKDKPLLIWSVEAFEHIESIDHIIIVSPQKHIKDTEVLLNHYRIKKVLKTVTGGQTRQASAYNALTAHPFEDMDIILFHDAARPFVKSETIIDCLKATEEHGAAAVYTPVIDTIAEIGNETVKNIIPRQNLFQTQTPQCFRFGIIKKAHDNAIRNNIPDITDDVSLALAAGYTVHAVTGESINFKITTKSDFHIARLIAQDEY